MTGYTPEVVTALKDMKFRIHELEHPTPDTIASAIDSKFMLERSETCSRVFMHTYKSLSSKQWINSLPVTTWREGQEPDMNGYSTAEPSQVAGEAAKYYTMLFEDKVTCPDARARIMRKLRRKAISSASAEELERDITVEEVQAAMEHLPLGKQAGPNRVPNIVYRTLSKHFAPKLARVINEAIKGEPLPKAMLEGDITLLHKKNSREDIRNYRPITLLNADYKVYTRVLARRMRTVVHQFVSESQKGFVPDTFIADCSMLMNLVESWVNDDPEDRQGVMLFLDMEKAFDRVSYTYLNEALDTLGFGPKFRRAVNLMYDPTHICERFL